MLEIILHTTFSKDIYQDFELKRALVLFSVKQAESMSNLEE